MILLTETKPTLPSDWYYDTGHYQRELHAIWYRDWVCVGRAEEIPSAGDYIVANIGDQSLIIVRSGDDAIRAFHNTCRHRGSVICTKDSGRFRNGRIICPYHTWTYSLDGDLIATPHRVDTEDFQPSDYPLYDVHVGQWGGFIFVNLSDEPDKSLQDFLGAEAAGLANWPLKDLVSVQREISALKCNWKVFWENFSECYHCPRHHPELCKVIPMYKEGLMSSYEPEGDERVPDDLQLGMGEGKVTWTMDGQTSLPFFDGLSAEDIEEGMVYASFTASMWVVGHPDYVRSVRIYPTGPETTDLVVDWYLMPGTREKYGDEIAHMLELGRLVVEQDAELSDLNQLGLKSKAHKQGVLVPQEYAVWDFHEWLRSRLAISSQRHGLRPLAEQAEVQP